MSLAVIGKITSLKPIPGADRIRHAEVDCGSSGKWSGVVGLDIQLGELVTVFLQDAVLPADNERWEFMSRYNWRVRMARFKGVPSECVIIPGAPDLPVGTDLTQALGVTKYNKPLPPALAGDAVGNFPGFIPKTDEPNFQTVDDVLTLIELSEWVATLKCDGTSCTAWNDDAGELHVASRNLELREFNANGAGNTYWRTARQYDLSKLPAGHAIQFEIVGPGIQSNPMGLTQVEARAFTLHQFAGDMKGRCTHAEMQAAADAIGMPVAKVLMHGELGCVLTADDLRGMADIKYDNGKPAEGIVIRATEGSWSTKVINLNYRD